MPKKYQQKLQNNQLIRSKPLVQFAEIKNKLTVLPELKDLIPPLKEEEYQQLASSIMKEGCREALLVWEQEEGSNYVLVDGHNRYAICQEHHVDFRIHLMSFDSLREAKDFMIDNQLGRRNLTKEQASYLRGMRFHNEKQEKGKYERIHKPQNGAYEQAKTSERLAQEYKVSKNTIERDAEFALGLEKIGANNPTLKRDILSGNAKLSKTKIQKLAKINKVGSLKSVEDIERVLSKRIPKKPDLPIPDSQNRGLIAVESLEQLKKNIVKISRQIQTADQPHLLVDKLIEQANQLKALIGK